jgi:mono/diheme cytochrome c family protein
MIRLALCFVGSLIVNSCYLSATVSAAERQRDIASEVLSVFEARCAACHGPELAKPEGRFGYVSDLARLAANAEMVIPYFPDESEIWQLIRRAEMPPDDSPTGPLTSEEKEVIRSWIAKGARVTSPVDLNRAATDIDAHAPAVQRTRDSALIRPGVRHASRCPTHRRGFAQTGSVESDAARNSERSRGRTRL